MPADEEYSRVTEPERFHAVVDAADHLAVELEQSYDVVVSEAALDGCARARRFLPAAGAPLVLGVSSFPGVRAAFGAFDHVQSFPICGCDACDDAPDAVVDELRRVLGAVVGGAFVERLTRSSYEVQLTFPDGESGRTTPLDRTRRRQLEAMHPRGELRWPPWPRRLPSGSSARSTLTP